MRKLAPLARPSAGFLLVVMLFLALDLVFIGLLICGATTMLVGSGLFAAWLLLVVLSCSRRIRGETVEFIRMFLNAARNLNG
jgi:hypothetical protein